MLASPGSPESAKMTVCRRGCAAKDTDSQSTLVRKTENPRTEISQSENNQLNLENDCGRRTRDYLRLKFEIVHMIHARTCNAEDLPPRLRGRSCVWQRAARSLYSH